MTAWLGTFLSGIWAKIALVGAVALALLGVYAAIRKGGKDAERAAELQAGLDRIKKANDAAAKLDTSDKAVASDPDNLDRLR